MQDSASFWTDIKKLEEQLAKSPDSYCFARLSDVYLKVGLVDDALHIARQGVAKHPGYLSGQKALSMACHAKGLSDEAMKALKHVTEALPEDVPSQKMMGRLYVEAGNPGAASLAFRTALEFAPDDAECRIELDSLERSTGLKVSGFEPDENDEEIIEDLEMLEEIDILEEDQSESESNFQEVSSELDTLYGTHYDPLSTSTLAELYVGQGYIHKALEIYRSILADNPANQVIAERVNELEVLESGPAEAVQETDYTFNVEAENALVSKAPSEELVQKTEPETLTELGNVAELEGKQDIKGYSGSTSSVPSQGFADNSLATLDCWLENIRRIKSCR